MAGIIEWDPDHASSACVLCSKSWGTFRNRRHHCRHCGRLVCESCSSKKLILDVKPSSGNSGNGTMGSNDESLVVKSNTSGKYGQSFSESVNQDAQSSKGSSRPQRVCDDCYTLLTKKQQIKIEANSKREKEAALLAASSQVSQSLVRIFFLDGSYKTISYDQTTTAQDVATMLCYSVHIALFEVYQDLRDPEHYRLINPNDTIDEIMIRWELRNITTSKIVIPLYDFNSSKLSQAPPIQTILKRVHTFNGVSKTSSTTNNSKKGKSVSGMTTPPRGNANKDIVNISGSKLKSGSMSIKLNLDDYDDYEGTRIVPGNIQEDNRNYPQYGNRESEDVIEEVIKDMVDLGILDHSDLTPTAGVIINMSGNATSSSKRIRYGIQRLCDEICKIRGDLAELQGKYEMTRSIHMKTMNSANNETNSSSQEVESKGYNATMSSRIAAVLQTSTISFSCRLDSKVKYSNDQSMQGNYSKDRTITAFNTPIKSRHMTRSRSFNASSSGQTFLDTYAAQMNSNTSIDDGVSTPKQGTKSPMKKGKSLVGLFKKKSKSKASKTDSIDSPSTAARIVVDQSMDSIVTRLADLPPTLGELYGNDVRNITEALTNYIQALRDQDVHDVTRIFFKQLQGVEVFIMMYEEILGTVLEGDTDPSASVLLHVYEIAVAMEGMYDYLINTAEKWKANLTSLILRLFRKHLQLPLSQPDMISLLLQILSKEGLLGSSYIYDTVKQVIDDAFDGNNTTAGDDSVLDAIIPALAIYKPIATASVNKWTTQTTTAMPAPSRNASFISLTAAPVLGVVTDAMAVAAPVATGGYGYDYERIFYMMNRISSTLHLIVGDFMPLFPSTEFNLMTLYQERAYEKVRDDVTTFYFTNKSTLSKTQLLMLLTFMNHQQTLLSRYPQLDISLYVELGGDIIRQLLTIVQTSLRSLMSRLIQNEEKGVSTARMEESVGLMSQWPSLLLEDLEETFAATTRDGLQASSKEQILLATIEILPELPSKLITVLDKVDPIKSLTMIDRLCCYVTNHTSFALKLSESVDGVLEHLESIYSRATISNQSSTSILPRLQDMCVAVRSKHFEASHKAADVICKVMATEFKEILKQGLFRSPWDNDVRVVQATQALLTKYHSDLSLWLCGNPSFIAKIISYGVRAIADFYLEILLVTAVQMSPKILDRLHEDFQMLSTYFKEFNEYFSSTATFAQPSQTNTPTASTPTTSSGLSRFKRLAQLNKTSTAPSFQIGIASTGFITESGRHIIGLEACLKPWKDVLSALSMDTRLLSEFVRNELYMDFGPHTMKVWNTIMLMRGETKKVVDTMYDLIMKQWNPAAITPLNSVTFQDKLKSSKR